MPEADNSYQATWVGALMRQLAPADAPRQEFFFGDLP